MELNNIFAKYFNPVVPKSSQVNNEFCKKCGGRCCKAMGCHISPFDLKEISYTAIKSLIDESDCISIDWWNGNPDTNESSSNRVYFLRIKNSNGDIIDPSFGGKCAILTDNGCPLSFEYRPKGARELLPCDDEEECIVDYSKQQCAIDWMPYQDIMSELYDYYYDNGNTDSPMLNFMELMELMALTTDIGLPPELILGGSDE